LSPVAACDLPAAAHKICTHRHRATSFLSLQNYFREGAPAQRTALSRQRFAIGTTLVKSRSRRRYSSRGLRQGIFTNSAPASPDAAPSHQMSFRRQNIGGVHMYTGWLFKPRKCFLRRKWICKNGVS
jgi:hypothetical protein